MTRENIGSPEHRPDEEALDRKAEQDGHRQHAQQQRREGMMPGMLRD